MPRPSTSLLLLTPLLLAQAARPAPQPTAPAAAFTLEQVMSAPFVSDLCAAPALGRVAWVEDSQGRRNLWVAEPGHSRNARQITHYDADDGMEISGLSWSADGAWLAYTRGGDTENPELPAPNPAHILPGVKQEVWLVSADGNGQPRDLGEGYAPAIAPRGDRVAFLQKGQVWTVSMKDQAARAAPLFTARGVIGSLRWSPDGAALAFVSSRDDHAFVGVYHFAGDTVTYLEPGTYNDGDPAWSPDGRRIAFVRQPPMSEYAARWARTGAVPWSILVADTATGVAAVAWQADPGAGSLFHGTAGTTQLWWAAGDRIVFPWERGGWTHLYSVGAAGGRRATELTPGQDFEVETVALAPDRQRLVYSSNQHDDDPDDQDRRHLWSVRADGSEGPRRLTEGPGIETAPAVASDGSVALVAADARLPAHAAALEGSRLRSLAPGSVPAAFPAERLVVPQRVIFRAADGMPIHGQLFLPRDGRAAHPAVVFFHGGSRRQMLLGWHPMAYYSNAYAMNQYLASRGYIVLSVNYRSGTGYGLDFRQALHYGPGGASEYNDVAGAGLYLQGRPDVEAARIGAWGGSYGGYLTALALARGSKLFSAGVDLHGVHDWSLEIDLWRPQSWYTFDREAASRLAWSSSPMASLDTWTSPVLLIQGDDDRNVLFAQTVRLANALRARGVPVEERVFPDEIHDFLLFRSWVTAYQLGADFFDRRLRAAAQP